jgi:hypothetical protein
MLPASSSPFYTACSPLLLLLAFVASTLGFFALLDELAYALPALLADLRVELGAVFIAGMLAADVSAFRPASSTVIWPLPGASLSCAIARV